jgi:amino acid transporter
MSKPRLTLIPLICVMYLVVSGGPYGIEDAVAIAGPRLALLLCVLVPLTLSLPTALMAAELTALLPSEGGFYFWVKEACGPFAGFAEAYLTILYTAVDTAIYPVLFVTYVTSLLPVSAAMQVVLAIMLVWLCGLLNAIGIRLVGYTSTTWTAGLVAPFVVLVALGLPRLSHWQLSAEVATRPDLAGRLGGALTVVIWNFCGWENLSMVAAEIEDPQRNYRRAVAIALPAVALGYFLPLAVCLQGVTDAVSWHTGSFAEQGVRIGGALLGMSIAIGGALSSFAIFEAAMLWVSRLPFILARERYLPASLTAVWSSHDVPGRSLLLCCAIFTLLIPLGFITLVVFDVFFYMLALMLEMAALVRLRRLYPARNGLFMIRGGRTAVYVVALAPLFTWFATFGLAVAHRGDDLIIAGVLAGCVWPVYRLLRRRYGGPQPSSTTTPSGSASGRRIVDIEEGKGSDDQGVSDSAGRDHPLDIRQRH